MMQCFRSVTRENGGNVQIYRTSSGGYGTCSGAQRSLVEVMILFVSVTGPQEIAKSHADLKNLPMERDMKAPI